MKQSVKLTFLFLLLSVSTIAQKNNERIFKDKHGHHHKMGNYTSRFGIFINPLGPVEFQEGAAGLGVNAMLSRRWDISAELSYLYQGWGEKTYDKIIHNGYRAVFTVKRLSYTRVFFYGLDFRIKSYDFTDQLDFINTTIPDTLYNFKHNGRNTLYGFGGLAGLRLPLSKNRKWAMELNLGIGAKFRKISRKNVPAGYQYTDIIRPKDFSFIYEQNFEGWTGYVPGAVRFMYLF